MATIRLVQLSDENKNRRVALVAGDRLRLLDGATSIYDFAMQAIRQASSLSDVVGDAVGGDELDYDSIYSAGSDWRILAPLDHPTSPANCLVSGTGLTHQASAAGRQAMHVAESSAESAMTDSMRIYQWGVEGGSPAPGQIGVQPEWFWKGNGASLKGFGQRLSVPSFADDGGEEAEVAGLYVIDPAGQPRRVGFAIGNEFSDHVMEKKNYLYLAPSKLRDCAIGPELVVGGKFDDLRGTVRIDRGGEIIWSKQIATGEAHMCHSLANMEHHQFKYPAHRRPGDVHVHFVGTGALSYSEGVTLDDGDVMVVDFPDLGRPLRNPIKIGDQPESLIEIEPL
jgi:hypothetical protein